MCTWSRAVLQKSKNAEVVYISKFFKKNSPIRIMLKSMLSSDEVFTAGCLLLRACSKGDTDQVKQMLAANGSLLTFSDYDRRSALHVAASEGHLGLVTLLLDMGANPNRSDRWGGAPQAIDHLPRVVQTMQHAACGSTRA